MTMHGFKASGEGGHHLTTHLAKDATKLLAIHCHRHAAAAAVVFVVIKRLGNGRQPSC